MSPIIRLDQAQQFAAINVLSDPGAIGGPVIVPSCAQIVLGWALESGKTGRNVLYGRYTGAFAGSSAQATAIIQALTTGAAWTALQGFLATNTILSTVQIRDVNSAGNPFIPNTSGGGTGSSASPALPNEVAMAITMRTARTGPQNRGRMFVPGWATNALGAGNVLAGAGVTALGNWAGTISGALSAQGYVWVIGQRARAAYTGSTGTQHPARPANSVPITAAVVRDNHWDSQRRRGLK